MTAHYRTTATDLANAISGRPPQTVRIIKTVRSLFGAKHYVVSVNGEWFVVYADATIRSLHNGWTPAELELEAAPDDDEEADEFDGDYAHATHWPSLYNAMRNR
jgi:hypothetical protein